MKILYYLLFGLLLPAVSYSATYYVAKNGSNSNPGSEASPFLTIQYGANALSAGDTLYVKQGTYKERIADYGKAGTISARVTISAFGTDEVIIDASPTMAGSWSLVSGSIYRRAIGFKASNVIYNETPLIPSVVQTGDTSVYNQSTMQEGYFFYDTNSGYLYAWLPGGVAPDDNLHVVEWDETNKPNGIYLWNSSYWTFNKLTIAYATWYGINYQADSGGTGHNTVTNCTIKFCGQNGIGLGPYSTVTGNHVYYNVMMNFPRGRYNQGYGGWGGGVSAGHDSIFENNTIHNNGGEGLISYLSDNMIYRGNTIYDNWSVNLYVDNESNILVENNFIYCNDPNYSEAVNSGGVLNNIQKRVRGMGIMTADEYYDGIARLNNVTIRNNIISNCRYGYWHSADVSGSAPKNIKIFNNTIVTPDDTSEFASNPGDGTNFFGIGLRDYYGTATGNEIINNIIVARNSRNYAIWAETNGDMFSKFTLISNLIFNTAATTPIHWGPTYDTTYDFTLSQWQALSGTAHGAGDLSVSPVFTGGANAFAVTYYALATGSPAIGAGAMLSGFTTDINGATRSIPWDMGAIEHAASASGKRYRGVRFE